MITKVNYQKDLNPEQLAVVEAPGGPMLIIAGAGSGKTRTVTYRVARLIESGVDPGRILLVTFTNKAAREMLHRVELLVGMRVSRLWGGTFHHVGNMTLRRHTQLLGYTRGFLILDREDAKDLIDTCVADLAIDRKARRFPKGDVLIAAMSLALNTEQNVEDVITDRYPAFTHLTGEILRVAQRYREKKKALNVMDYDDLLTNWKTLLTEHPAVREASADRFLHILVDEYQDTNRLQAEVVDLLASRHRNLVVVGDDAQSIYSFRGAHFANIMEFPRRYPDAKVFRLETNYRSTPEILELANSSICHNHRQFEKHLRAVRKSGERPSLVSLRDVFQQASFVAEKILELHDEGLRLSDIAVLYRAHYHSMELQMELVRRGIPFVVRSGLRFFEQAHIKDTCAYLKVIVNPRDELAWKRIARHWPRIGNATAEKIWQHLSSSRAPLAQSLESEELLGQIPKAAHTGWQDCVALLKTLLRPGLLTAPGEMIGMVLEGGYDEHLQARHPDWMERAEDVRQLARFAGQYQSAREFLSELALFGTVESEVVVTGGGDDDHVVLSTIHQAKGLEWPAVFLVWLADGRFPSARSLEAEEALEEERRLFYVAATRAKDLLYLCYPMLNEGSMMAGSYLMKPSRFIEELEPSTYENLVVEEMLADLREGMTEEES